MPITSEPIKLHPENPHYLLFRGKPTILLGSTEHYGAVLNLDFEYLPYLNELQARGLNLTRTFSGSYREIPGSFKIEHNTLAPVPGRFICPWARSPVPGASDGGNKFDLSKWDPVYFSRLKDFIRAAGRRGIVAEVVLFCTLYNDELWAANPLNPLNNVNDVGRVPREQVFALRDRAVTTIQVALVRKILSELKSFDNLYYEVCNEPYFAGVSEDWQNHIIGTILETEALFPARHLIAQNVANGYEQIYTPNGAVSIFNFHYAWPPVAVGMNFHLHKPLAFDETGFRGSSDRVYRMNAWEFILAGGSIFDNLDYSFTSAHPDGTARQSAPGGGSPALRAQYHILRDFIYGFDFLRMAPAASIVRGGATPGPNAGYVWNYERAADVTIQEFPSGPRAWVLAEEGKAYAIYIADGSQLDLLLSIPAGSYRSEWVNTKTGDVEKAETFSHAGGEKRLVSPDYSDDIALRIKRVSRS